MTNSKIRLHIYSNNRPQPNRRVYLERKMGANEPLMTVASLITDHTGYVSFSLAPSRRRLPGGQPDLDAIPLGALSVRVQGDATHETWLHSLYGLPSSATVKDIGCRGAVLPVEPQQGAASNDNSEVSEGGCFVRPNGSSIEDPDLCDYEISPASIVDHRLVRRGDDCCDRPVPATGAISETDIWRVVVYNDSDTPQVIPSTEALVNPEDKPIEQTGLRWGLLERYRQTWTHLGHSLGEIVYSLALAPGESTQLAVIEWSREDLGLRDDAIKSSEGLEHDQRTNRDIVETTKAALREDQGGGSFQAGAAASIPIKQVQLNVGIGGGVTHSWGQRNLSGEGKQNLHQRVMQQSQLQRQQNSTVIVQGRAREDNRLAVRAVANHNHCHALTIQYFEVLRHLALTTRFVEHERAVLVPHAVLDFDKEKVERWRHLLKPAALDAAVADGFAALERSVTGRPAPKGVTPLAPGKGTDNPLGAIGKFKIKTLRITITSSPTQSHQVKDSSASIDLDWEGAPPGTQTLKVHQKGMPTAALAFPLEPPQQGLDADLADARLDVSSTALKTFRLSLSNHSRTEWAAWAVKGIKIEGFGDAGLPGLHTLFDKAESVILEAAPGSTVSREFAFGAVPTKTSPEVQPDTELIDDKVAIAKLIEHIKNNAVHYSRAVWLGLNDGARRMLIEHKFGSSVAGSIDGPPLAISGNHVAFRWSGEMPPWFKAMIESEDFRSVPLSPETSIVLLPTRGLFAEAMLGHCNACEKRDVTRMWDWTEATVEPLPTLTGLSPGQKGSTVIPDAPQLPSSVLNIQAAPTMPDPSGLATTLAGITQGGIFRDMSGMAEVTSLLKTLSNNASLDQATRQKAAEAAAKMAAASATGSSGGGQRKPSARETFDNLTVANEIAKSAGKMGWSPATTEEVTKNVVGGVQLAGYSEEGETAGGIRAFPGLDPTIAEPGSRTCCSIFPGGVSGFGMTQYLDPFRLGEHSYGSSGLFPTDVVGEIYTARGGFVDLGHVRDLADMTRYLASRTFAWRLPVRGNWQPAEERVDLRPEAGARTLILTKIVDGCVECACLIGARAAYDLAIWHEIVTWFTNVRYSSFSPEDNFSNLLGSLLGALATKTRGTGYNEAMTDQLDRLLKILQAQPSSTARSAIEQLNGLWFLDNDVATGLLGGNHPNNKGLLWRRHINPLPTVMPWLVTDLNGQTFTYSDPIAGVHRKTIAFELGNPAPAPFMLEPPQYGPRGEVITDYYTIEIDVDTRIVPVSVLPPGRTLVHSDDLPDIVDRVRTLILAQYPRGDQPSAP